MTSRPIVRFNFCALARKQLLPVLQAVREALRGELQQVAAVWLDCQHQRLKVGQLPDDCPLRIPPMTRDELQDAMHNCLAWFCRHEGSDVTRRFMRAVGEALVVEYARLAEQAAEEKGLTLDEESP